MKIEFISSAGLFRNQIYLDAKTFKKERGVYPTTQELIKAEGENVFLLTGLTNFKALPNKTLLRTDLPQYDGSLHYGALYKPRPFTIRCGRNVGIMRIYRELYADRGLFTMIATEDGVSISMLVTATGTDEEYSMSFDGPTLKYNLEQLTTGTVKDFIYYSTPTDFIYPYQALYPNPELFPITIEQQGVYEAGNEYVQLFDVANPSGGMFYVDTGSDVSPIVMSNIMINGVSYEDHILAPPELGWSLVVSDAGRMSIYVNGVEVTVLPDFNFGGFKSHSNRFSCDISFGDMSVNNTGWVGTWWSSYGNDLTLGGH